MSRYLKIWHLYDKYVEEMEGQTKAESNSNK